VRALPYALRSVSPVELAERLQAERRGIAFLLYLDGEGRQRIVDLSGRDRPLCIGRETSNDIPLDWDDGVSRVHAMFEPVGGAWTLVDDGLSRNGSFVNGERVRSRRRLADGDLIMLGHTLLAFCGAAGSDAGATAPAADALPPALSPAQQRVLGALCRPLLEDTFAAPPSNREIADELVISVDTVKSHLHALFELFGVQELPQNRKRSELIRRALASGVVRLEV
jgi:pSer/pThr/pTyr-binding forkhead associated (FHA) protein